jgi:ribose 5-phosphate isomerase B
MKLAIGCDHGGFQLKSIVIKELPKWGHKVEDVGAHTFVDEDDYPDYTLFVAKSIQEGRCERGILICGSGIGASVAANKLHGIRAAICHDTFSARQGVEDDNMNVLCLGGRVVGVSLALEVIKTFLEARFSGLERHQRRLNKVAEFERT